MNISQKIRTALTSALIVVLILLFVWYGSLRPDPEEGNYPGPEQLIDGYDEYIDKEVQVYGKVIDTDPLTIEVEHGEESMELNITGTNVSANQGDKLSVYGTAKQNRTIHAENTVRHPYFNHMYMYAVSFIAAAWISIRIVKQWRWNGEELRFEKREGSPGLKQILSGGKEDG